MAREEDDDSDDTDSQEDGAYNKKGKTGNSREDIQKKLKVFEDDDDDEGEGSDSDEDEDDSYDQEMDNDDDDDLVSSNDDAGSSGEKKKSGSKTNEEKISFNTAQDMPEEDQIVVKQNEQANGPSKQDVSGGISLDSKDAQVSDPTITTNVTQSEPTDK